MEEKMVWHYTTRQQGENIIKDGVIKVSKDDKKAGWKPAVWFSTQQFWEPTACKVINVDGSWLSGDEGMKSQHEIVGIYRFGIIFNATNLTTWAKYQYVSKISLQMYRSMEIAGKRGGGNPSDWFAIFHNIPRSQWKKVEAFDGNDWVTLDF